MHLYFASSTKRKKRKKKFMLIAGTSRAHRKKLHLPILRDKTGFEFTKIFFLPNIPIIWGANNLKK